MGCPCFVVSSVLVVFTTFFNVELAFKEQNSLYTHELVFIASTPKLSPARALASRYTSTPFKTNSNSPSRLPSPGYVSVSKFTARNGLCSVRPHLGLLP